MDDVTLAHPALPDEAAKLCERRRAIKQRTTRGMLLFNAGAVVGLVGDAWAVRSSVGGYYLVDLQKEVCSCDDFVHYGSDRDVCCKHLFAAAIAHATRRNSRPHACTHGTVYVGHVDADGIEHVTGYPCRRCAAERG
jgi:hypothetical protein